MDTRDGGADWRAIDRRDRTTYTCVPMLVRTRRDRVTWGGGRLGLVNISVLASERKSLRRWVLLIESLFANV